MRPVTLVTKSVCTGGAETKAYEGFGLQVLLAASTALRQNAQLQLGGLGVHVAELGHSAGFVRIDNTKDDLHR